MGGHGDAVVAKFYDELGGSYLPTETTVAFLRARRELGPLLDIGAGVGRVAIPMANAGVDVVAVEKSRDMVDRLKQLADDQADDPGAGSIEVVHAAFPDFDTATRFGTVLMSFNTLLLAPTVDDQRAWLRRARDLCAPGGAVVVENWLPTYVEGGSALRPYGPLREDVFAITADRVDLATQSMERTWILLSCEDGVEMFTTSSRFVRPAELALMAEAEGLTVAAHFADWEQTPFHDHAGWSIVCLEPRVA